ncbi:hypothetical protein CEXT_288201 [Caerostris extrusa]|uniref:Uncharacterized protein n=1 Tax=Caerostris extrusa TaxID=172846 RepID=A0AAV4MPR9_CAEEX|nr:hypothetical protein CEXT_288201 [Caerostris extrusa]
MLPGWSFPGYAKSGSWTINVSVWFTAKEELVMVITSVVTVGLQAGQVRKIVMDSFRFIGIRFFETFAAFFSPDCL